MEILPSILGILDASDASLPGNINFHTLLTSVIDMFEYGINNL